MAPALTIMGVEFPIEKLMGSKSLTAYWHTGLYVTLESTQGDPLALVVCSALAVAVAHCMHACGWQAACHGSDRLSERGCSLYTAAPPTACLAIAL